jgi:3-hydroxyisobutyrate dehydrogenase-like beta-hydroxyacid dehydrogenase
VTSTVGVLGLGAMGAPMARRLVAEGFRVSVYDLDEARVSALASAGATGASSPADAASGVDARLVMVVDAAQVEDVLCGADGAAGATQAPVVLTSTVGPRQVAALSARLAERGVDLLDAPVSGGVTRAGEGVLAIMTGGPPELHERMRPVLDALGSTVVHCGPEPGDGQAVKLVNQLLAGVHIAAAAEAIAFAEALGLDPAAIHPLLTAGAASSFMLEDRGARMLDPGDGEVRSALDIFVKDLGLVAESARDRRFAAPMAETAAQLFTMASARGLGRRDDSSLVEFLRARERLGG